MGRVSNRTFNEPSLLTKPTPMRVHIESFPFSLLVIWKTSLLIPSDINFPFLVGLEANLMSRATCDIDSKDDANAPRRHKKCNVIKNYQGLRGAIAIHP